MNQERFGAFQSSRAAGRNGVITVVFCVVATVVTTLAWAGVSFSDLFNLF